MNNGKLYPLPTLNCVIKGIKYKSVYSTNIVELIDNNNYPVRMTKFMFYHY